MKGYKCFNKGLICRGKQYAENTVFEEPEAKICVNGMHFCENPFDVLDYYDFMDDNGELNEFAEVEALDEVKTNDKKKYCTKKLKIGAKLSLAGFIKACVDFVIEKTMFIEMEDNTVSAEGFAKIASSGDFAQIASSGDSAQIASSGNSAQIASSGENCVICCTGDDSRVKAKKGSWITLSEWKWDEEKQDYTPVNVKTEYVDGERIKENVFYTLRDGEFQEVKP